MDPCAIFLMKYDMFILWLTCFCWLTPLGPLLTGYVWIFYFIFWCISHIAWKNATLMKGF